MAQPLAPEAIREVIAGLLASAHPDIPEIDRDHISHELSTRVMVGAYGVGVERIERVWPVGEHSICEYVLNNGETAYASLLATDCPKYKSLREFLRS